MESQQQPKSGDTLFSEAMPSSDAPLAKPAPGSQPSEWQRLGKQFAVWLGQLPDLLGQSFNESKQSFISVALIIAALVTLRVVLTILVAVNGIPLLEPTFELVGIGYSVWFIYRYLLKAETRQELFQEIQGFLNK